jgi:succinoglycan biosynthesis protein ExoM
MNELISICLCTYKRNSVIDTLVGISKLTLSDVFSFEVVVIDSDIAGSAINLVQNFSNHYPNLKINYVKANVSGLVVARNLAVTHAKGSWIAFIDDDEVPEPDWLINLHSCAFEFQASVVFGKVNINYPKNTPRWIIKSDIFSYGKKNLESGTVVHTGATSNVLINKGILLNESIIFDVRFNETGGEDSDLFLRLGKKNKMIFCKEAIVTETIEEKRVNYLYLVKRAIRSGETYYDIFNVSSNLSINFFNQILFLLKFIVALLLGVILMIFGISIAIKFHIKAGANFGKLKASLGFKPLKLYKPD